MANRADQQARRRRDASPGHTPGQREAVPSARTAPARRRDRSVASKNDSVSTHTVETGQRVDVPVVEEQLSVEKRTIETGKVVVHVEPVVERQELEVPLLEESVEVERVPVNRFVSAGEPVRQEGDVTVVPVYEEGLVGAKRLMV